MIGGNNMDLSIDYEKTRKLGNQIIDKGTEFKGILDKLEQENNEIKNSWKGSDSSKYTSAVEREIGNMRVLKQAIDDMGTFLINAANAYQRVNETNQEGVR